jgi:hypothetical protein
MLEVREGRGKVAVPLPEYLDYPSTCCFKKLILSAEYYTQWKFGRVSTGTSFKIKHQSKD